MPTSTTTIAAQVAVVIPCYRVREQIITVLRAIGEEVSRIYVVDDACPEGSGELVTQQCDDPRVGVLQNTTNLGVGGAVKRGYRAALDDGATVIVKLDGDGQMDPALIPALIATLIVTKAGYVKGDRFHTSRSSYGMPLIRKFGNRCFSLFARFSTGYHQLSDVLNGFTVIRAEILRDLPLDEVADDYFFESDMLFHLGKRGVKVGALPMEACYGGQPSSLSILHTLFTFPPRYLVRAVMRFFGSPRFTCPTTPPARSSTSESSAQHSTSGPRLADSR